MTKKRIIYRYVGPLNLQGSKSLRPGQFISKALFDALPRVDTIAQEVRIK